MPAFDVPNRLKALREAAGLSIRALADRLNMSSSGYAHYENPERFKAPFLPMQFAQELTQVLTPLGVPGDQVMALAGAASATAQAPAPEGFAEDAARPWAPAGGDDDLRGAIRALAPAAGNPGTYQITRPIPALGLLRGDIVIVDLKRVPAPGDLALGNAMTSGGDTCTVIGRFVPPHLLTAETLAEGGALDVTTGAVALYHPILASFRRRFGPPG